MPTVKMVNQKDVVEDIYIGDDKDGNVVTIDEQSFLKNGLLIIGTKNSGKEKLFNQIAKSGMIVPTLDTKGKMRVPFAAATTVMIASKPDHCFYLYAIPREYKRNKGVELISPSVNMQVRNELLGMKSFDFDKVNEILDFTKLCKEKGIAVIDMEHYRYEEASIRAVGMLLLNLQIEMHDTAGTSKRRFYLMIDDAWMYLPYLSSIIKYGSEYNMSSVLTFDSRSQYKDYETIIENNIQNVLLMGNLRFEDAKYFSERLSIPLEELLNGGNDHGYLASYDKDMHFTMKKFFFTNKFFTEDDDRLISNLASKYKKEMIKASSDEEYIKDIMTAYAQYIAEQNQGYEVGTTADSMRRVAQEIEESVTGKPVTIERPRPVIQEEDAKQDEPVTILGTVRQAPVAAPSVPKTTLRKPDPSGLKALMGIVESAPERIQKEVAKQGFPTTPKSESKTNDAPKEAGDGNDNNAAKNASPRPRGSAFNPSMKTENVNADRSFQSRNASMPTYKAPNREFKKNVSQTNDNANAQKQKSDKHSAPQQSQNDSSKKKKKQKQNPAPRPTGNDPVKKVEQKKKERPVAQNNKPKNESAPETPQKQVLDERLVPKTSAVESVTIEEALETPVKAVEEIVEETTKEAPVEPKERLSDDSEVPQVEEQEKDVAEELPETPTVKQERCVEEVAENIAPEIAEETSDGSQEDEETGEDDVIMLDDDVELVEEEPEESLDLFDDVETTQERPRDALVGLSNNMAMLSFNTKSSGRDFSHDSPNSSQMIEKLKDRGRSANFFSKRREIELMEKSKK